MTRQSARGGPVLVPQSKVRPPRSRKGLVRREALVRAVLAEPADALVVLAPPGFGKTTFVTQWSAAAGRPVAWATVGHVDSDPVVLMSTVLAALSACGIGFELPTGTLTGDEPAFSRRVLPAFQRSLESLQAPVTLVIDDIHAMSGVTAAVILSAALDALPPGSGLALVGRARPDLPIELWMSQGRAQQIGPDQLALTQTEAGHFAAQVMQRAPSRAELTELLEATRGWPAAVYLSAVGLREGVTQVHSANVVQDYLSAQVMDLLDPELRDFLRDCSILAAMSAPLCDTERGTPSSATRLKQAERATLLVTRLEGHGDWYRMHPLLRSRLRQELGELGRDHGARLHARAASWYDEHGFVDEAIRHATQAGDRDALGRLMWAHAPDLLLLGRTSTVARWLHAVDRRDVTQSAGLALTAAWTGVTQADAAAALHWAGVAAEALGPGWETRLDRSRMEPALLLLVALSGRQGYEESSKMAADAAAALQRSDGVWTLALMLDGWFGILGGHVQEGNETLEEARREAESVAAVTTQVEAAALLAVVHIGDGRWATAERHVAQGTRAWVDHDMQDVLTSTGLLFAAAALLAARQGREAEARTFLARTEPLVSRLGPVMPWAQVLVDALAARTLAMLGENRDARAHQQQAQEGLRSTPGSPFLDRLVQAAGAAVLAASPLAALTTAERRVWDHLGERLTVKELGAELYLSPDTVKTHLASIYRKLGVSSRREAQALADSLRGS